VARILLIDDDDLVRSSVETHLLRGGHEVTAAADGREGIRLFGDGGFDLVLTDIIMPEVEGIETVQRIRRLDAEVPIIAMTGGPTRTVRGETDLGSDYLRMATALGATTAIRKPFTPRQLLEMIAGCLARRPPTRRPGETRS